MSDFDHDGFNEVFVANDGRANHLLKIDTREPSRISEMPVEWRPALMEASGLTWELQQVILIATGFKTCTSAIFMISQIITSCNGVSVFSPIFRFDINMKNGQNPMWVLASKPSILTAMAGLILATNGHIFDMTAKEPLQMPAQVVMQRAGKFNWTQTKDPTRGKSNISDAPLPKWITTEIIGWTSSSVILIAHWHC